MSDYLFTFVCEFGGGTYVSQVHALNEQEALFAWGDFLRRNSPMGKETALIADGVLNEIEAPVPLDGLEGVWCWTKDIAGRLVLANIVRSG